MNLPYPSGILQS